MKRLFKNVMVLCAILLASGCAVKTVKSFPTQGRNLVQGSDVVVNVSQQELYADIIRSQTSAAMGGGLLFALIDSSIDSSNAKDAAEAVKPVQDSMLDYNFSNSAKQAFDQSLSKVSWLHNQKTVVEKEVTTKKLQTTFSTTTADNVMFITMDYHLSADFSTLLMSANVSMFPRNDKLKTIRNEIFKKTPKEEGPGNNDLDARIYSNQFFVNYQLQPTTEKTQQAYIKKWTANQGSLIKQEMDRCLETIATMIAYDVDSVALPEGTKIKSEKVHYLTGQKIELVKGMDIVRVERGQLHAFNANNSDSESE